MTSCARVVWRSTSLRPRSLLEFIIAAVIIISVVVWVYLILTGGSAGQDTGVPSPTHV